MRTAVLLVALSTASIVTLCVSPDVSVVQAQTGGGTGGGTSSTTLSIVQVEDPDGTIRLTSNGVSPRLNEANCADPSDTTITFQSPVSPTNGFDLWVSNNSDCSDTTTRTGTTQTCFDIGQQFPSLDTNETFELTLAQLTVEGEVEPCETTTNNGILVYLFAFDSGQDTTTGDLTGINTYVGTIRVDPNPPVAPEMDSPETSVSGSSAVPISWDAITDGDLSSIFYQVALITTGSDCDSIDTTTEDDGDTSSDGGVSSETFLTLLSDDETGTSTTVDASSFGVPLGEAGLVAVRAVDVAGNLGDFSDGKCVLFVETTGFCDVFESMGDDCDAGGCSVSTPGRDAGRATSLGLLALGIIVAAVRRWRFRT